MPPKTCCRHRCKKKKACKHVCCKYTAIPQPLPGAGNVIVGFALGPPTFAAPAGDDSAGTDDGTADGTDDDDDGASPPDAMEVDDDVTTPAPPTPAATPQPFVDIVAPPASGRSGSQDTALSSVGPLIGMAGMTLNDGPVRHGPPRESDDGRDLPVNLSDFAGAQTVMGGGGLEGIAELRDLILSNLAPSELHPLVRVSRSWQNAIQTGRGTRRALFLVADSDLVTRRDEGRRETRITMHDSLFRPYQGPIPQGRGTSTFHALAQDPLQFSDDHPSMQAFITQPPTDMVEVCIWLWYTRRPTRANAALIRTSKTSLNIWQPGGITWRHIVAAFKQEAEKPMPDVFGARLEGTDLFSSFVEPVNTYVDHYRYPRDIREDLDSERRRRLPQWMRDWRARSTRAWRDQENDRIWEQRRAELNREHGRRTALLEEARTQAQTTTQGQTDTQTQTVARTTPLSPTTRPTTGPTTTPAGPPYDHTQLLTDWLAGRPANMTVAELDPLVWTAMSFMTPDAALVFADSVSLGN